MSILRNIIWDIGFISKFNRYISNIIRKRLTLFKMAAYFGWKKAYFCGKYRNETGMSFLIFYKRKFEIVKYRLVYTSKGVGETSKELVF